MPDPETHGTPVFNSDRRIIALKRRLVREATLAISMLEQALAALWKLDADAAAAVRREDDRIDREEVAIEQETLEILALYHPFARDFRVLAFIIKVNADIERVADHAASIAKIAIRIAGRAKGLGPPRWPTALTELGERVPAMCHELMRCVLDEDTEAARKLVAYDSVIDSLDRRLFDEVLEMTRGGSEDSIAVGLYVARIGRELERIGDLQVNIAEDLVYLTSGQIIRHAKRAARQGPAQASS